MTKGVVYIVIGVLAVQAALGLRDETAGARGALAVIVRQPSGRLLLGVLAAGLAGHVIWRFLQAALDPSNEGRGVKGVAKRLAYALSGLAYALLASAAVRLVLGAAAGGNGCPAQDWAARLLARPFGPWLVGAAGVAVIAMALYALAYSGKFRESLQPDALTGITGTCVTWIGRIGLAARDLVLGLIGVFLIWSALESDPRKVRGLDGALEALARQPHGPWVLCLVAAGLVAYGAHLFVEARFRRIPAE